MQQALDAEVPGFRTFRIDNYHHDLAVYLRRAGLITRRQAPFAVIGDFDGDGKPDAAVDGYSPQYSGLVVVLSRGGRYAARKLADFGHEDDSTVSGKIDYLALVSRGAVQADTTEGCDAKVPLNLTGDAFESVFFEKASTLHFWNGDRFVAACTSD